MAEAEQQTDVNERDECPIPDTDDRHTEAHYFLERMMNEYHSPGPFRWNLNAFIQALRNVTFVLQSELSGFPGFEEWYKYQRQIMREDSLLAKFIEGRNIVVKQGSLIVSSSAQIGMFRYRKLKMAITSPIDPNMPSEYALKEIAPKLGFIDDGHIAIGEEYGVRRKWMAPELGEGEVLSLCDAAWARIGRVVADAHSLAGCAMNVPPEDGHDPERCNLLTETDLDPSLVEKWGW